MMVAGGIGALAATAPLELALRFATWRAIFVALAVDDLCSGCCSSGSGCPTSPKPAQTTGIRGAVGRRREVFTHPRFWWIAPLGGIVMGSFMAIQGLWRCRG